MLGLIMAFQDMDYSKGILRSPLGDTAADPTLGPSGRQLRLNCWLKNLR